MMIVVSMLMLPVMIVRFYMGVFQMVLIDFPLIVASFWSISAFYLYAQKVLYPKSWWKPIAFLPMLMAAGVALTVSNSKGVIEALLGIQTSFARTAKYGIGQKAEGANSLQTQERLAAVRGIGDWRVFRLHGGFCH